MEQVLYSLPDGWSWRKLSELAKTTSGGTPSRSNKDYWGGSIPWVKSGELGDSRVEKNEEFITEVGLKNSSAKLFPKESLLLALYGATAGKLGVLTYDAATNQAVCCISQDDQLLARDFLRYYLLSQRKKIIEDSFGGAQPNISQAYVREIDIPTPPLTEQKRIVEKLDVLLSRIDTAVEHLQESIALADALFESSQSEIFNDVLSNYQHSTIDEICIVTSSKRIFKADYVESGIPFYRTKEIVDLSKEKNISTELFIDKEKFSEICGKFGAPKKGDLLFSAVGTIGVMWIVDEREFYFKDGNLLWLKDMNGVTPEYLKSAISAVLTEKIKDRSQGAAYKAISITNLKAFEIPLPSIEEQKSIVAKIEHVSSVTKKTKQELSLQINDLHNLKASILDSAFKGEL